MPSSPQSAQGAPEATAAKSARARASAPELPSPTPPPAERQQHARERRRVVRVVEAEGKAVNQSPPLARVAEDDLERRVHLSHVGGLRRHI